ncbi:hypothetical protein CON01_30330 [Bacillus thuringiensis]|uniref:Uncharacterized protein n=1 Tax=Bacillus thuringiensis TaxID=1428 RepID=A0A9X6TU48_BACTU|nr:hypothetical protein [Bacillus thuringiensis]PED10793.1 hypothetical protein CON01_30330 [Bacillus thuringiensis]PEF87063.1 hypothetical protein CON51_12550 [Bacillus thuringiensis]PES46501.1 hypothetical protein CN506_31605 [Bacillus thuringiensis]PEV06794.1 hypothetical protein CN417_18080 [Bacillus thuringiensis]PFD82020.1 hypothetical protein CN306_31605 [Bacillus thuringiensis]
MYNPYPPNTPNYYRSYSSNTYNPNNQYYSPYYHHNPYDFYYRDADGFGGTSCAPWHGRKYKWFRVHHKDMGKLLFQPLDIYCHATDPTQSTIAANFFSPGSCEMEVSEDFSPLDLSAPVEYHGSIPPKYCRW